MQTTDMAASICLTEREGGGGVGGGKEKKSGVPDLHMNTRKHMLLFSFCNPPGTHAPFGSY